ncbi:MAG: tRNA (adenosine(37)-N6)-threonylcarbamoyltransferase complex dimerization subunit type 1 TsaB [Tenacibaculum sp.]
MALILNIETATKNCSVCVAENYKLLSIREINNNNYSHAEKLHLFIQQVLSEANIQAKELSAVAVSKGPGSYTGLRIGVSSAKGICFACGIPLISTETLHSLAASISITEGHLIPVIDARRMEVYVSVYDKNLEQKSKIYAKHINKDSFAELLNKGPAHFVGDGARKCKEVISHKNAEFYSNKYPSSKNMIKLSFEKYKNNNFEDVAYFEPFYLKDFVATPEKSKN